mmetsp:Transcript_43108/g.60452  ORF Transcript_43108/g.60452 Transcript_43108/m.60452 type:complete len:861 (-) Transcript_43108:47-2629(-)|eukprot:CAMPEP_0201480262 /NCGR_PEP_ID=MMETSP0151_2-20130828/4773_1 /ASSEMBLY_ACC=CAM_ASM_000257 /TAXON_ID=200890 /ORGANISM="Paramoeba atlantica, Strain 621/1 / CCAP 1560/9" /LENGTH=860 /DNA_ID=CAMNT_0047862061 /DNA_START=104 /DNA_END=2686 /DNA_ORIENTATION=+
MAQNPGQDVDLEIEMDQVAAEPQENRRENPGMQVAGDDQDERLDDYDSPDLDRIAFDYIEENEAFQLDPNRAKSKLEVLSSSAIKWMLIWYYGAIVLTFIILVVWAIVVAIKFREEAENLESFILMEIDLLGTAAVSLIFFAFVLAYVFRIVFLPFKKKTVEMIWTCVMLSGLVIIFNPVFYSAAAIELLENNKDIQTSGNGLYVLVAAICYEFSTFFYMLCMIRLYGLYRNPKGFLEYVTFYAKVVIPVAIPLTVKLVSGLALDFRYYFTPFGAIITLLMLAFEGIWDTKLYVTVICTIVLEILLFIYIIHSARITWRKLAEVPYAPYRYKQLGFRFFLFHTMTLWGVLIMYDILVTASTPVDRYVNAYDRWKRDIESDGTGVSSSFGDSTMIFGQSYAFFPVILLLSVWAIEIAYVNLPITSRGIKGWFLPEKCQDPLPADAIHLTRVYALTEEKGLEARGSAISDLFCVETCVESLNLAKLVYNNCGSAEEFNESVDHDNKDCPVVDYIHLAALDTHCIIARGDNRVYVCFRGTKSLQNIKTDLKSTSLDADQFFTEQSTLNCVTYSQKGKAETVMIVGDDEDDDDLGMVQENSGATIPVEFARNEKRKTIMAIAAQDAAVTLGVAETPVVNGVRIHKGFLKAYLGARAAIFEKFKLQLQQDGAFEAVIVVGHSLGGALATLFSYDLSFRQQAPEMGGKKIVAYTFGSPRVGNRVFHNSYNMRIPENWRVVNAQDIVTQIPLGRMGFKHIGTMVLLDRNGNLMVDPSVIEKSWSHRTVASSGSHHLGGVYIKNLRKCIENLTDTHSNYEPNFWERKDEAEDVEKVEDEEEKNIVQRAFASIQQSLVKGPKKEEEGSD